jgi:cyclopropane fatty-acyl-phospholipid synthase-like methyltransferase
VQVLDLGGGTGSFLIAVLRQHPGLRATLFELPNVTSLTRQRLAKEPEGARIEIVAGDLFKDPPPRDHDAVIVANVVHVFSPQRNLDLFRRIRQHVSDGTRLLLVDLWTDPTHTQPLAAALLAGEFLVIAGEGDVYSENEVQSWLRETGWRQIEHKPLAGPASLIVAETATLS